MDDLNLEPLEPLDSLEPKEPQQAGPSRAPRLDFKRFILPAGILLLVILAVAIYLMIPSSPSEKIIAQVFSYDIRNTPDTTSIVVSVSNRQDKQAIIVQFYPVFFGKQRAPIYARSIEGSIIEGTTLPLVLNPGEVRLLKITVLIKKHELDVYAGRLKDSSHIIVFQDGPPPGQLQGDLGLGWRIVDADGKNHTSTARLASYILTTTPPGFSDSTALTHSWIRSEEPFELCRPEIAE